MKLVIDIPEDVYNYIKSHDTGEVVVDEAVKNGVLLEKIEKGHWVKENSVLRCSICDFGVARYDKYNYCPNCGVYIRGDVNEDSD